MLPEVPPPALRLGFDPDALASNWQALDRMSGAARAGAAVKADGYGLGVRKVVPVLGRVSMDLTAVDLTHAPDLAEGDWIAAEYALAESSTATGLSQYELLTLLGRRFGR